MRLPRCPICKREVAPGTSNKAFPFCSPRCKLIDLGRWLGEGYSVPHIAGEEDDDPDESPPAEYRRRSSDEDE